jgi:plastocyanin
VRAALALGLLLAPGVALLAPQPAAAATQHVMMERYAYSPATLTVRAGDSVTWANHDEAAHDVVTTSGPASFRSPLLQTNQSWTFTFTVPGTYAYYCSVHPDMRAQVVVQAADTPTAAPPPAPAQQPATRRPIVTTTAAAPPAAPATPNPAQPSQDPPITSTADVPAQASAAVVGERLDPMLIVAGIVAAIAVLCLLLIGARPEGP